VNGAEKGVLRGCKISHPAEDKADDPEDRDALRSVTWTWSKRWPTLRSSRVRAMAFCPCLKCWRLLY